MKLQKKEDPFKVIIIGDNFIDFEQFYYGNKPNKDIEDKLERLKKYRLQQTKKVYGKLGEERVTASI